MDDATKDLHCEVSRLCGQASACGTKVDYRTEASAQRAADVMLTKGSKDLEPYPCHWCAGWHIGRTMSREELEQMVEGLHMQHRSTT